MKVVLVTLLASWIVATMGCRSYSTPRVVRVGFAAGGTACRMSLDGQAQRAIEPSHLTNLVTALRLKHGDVLLVDRLSTEPGVVWLMTYCSDQRVGFYSLSVPEERDSIFSVPVCHWVAPFDDPVNLRDCIFYAEGHRLGRAEEGFRHLLEYINQKKPKRLFLLGSKYNWDSGWGPDMMPFEDSSHKRALEAALVSAGTEWLTPTALP